MTHRNQDDLILLGGVVPQPTGNIDTHGSLALPDDSVIFSFEYGALTKLDRCGQGSCPRALLNSAAVRLTFYATFSADTVMPSC
jgi:hypothetical protein